MTRVGFLYTRLRVEEKHLLDELEKRDGVEVVRINDGDTYFDINQLEEPVDVLFERRPHAARPGACDVVGGVASCVVAGHGGIPSGQGLRAKG